MRVILSIISILIIALVAFLAYLNTNVVMDLSTILKGSANTFTLSTVTIFIAGLIAGALWVTIYDAPVKRKFKEYQKKLEKTSIQTEEGSSKISVLEEKIKVLEKALDNALGKND